MCSAHGDGELSEFPPVRLAERSDCGTGPNRIVVLAHADNDRNERELCQEQFGNEFIMVPFSQVRQESSSCSFPCGFPPFEQLWPGSKAGCFFLIPARLGA